VRHPIVVEITQNVRVVASVTTDSLYMLYGFTAHVLAHIQRVLHQIDKVPTKNYVNLIMLFYIKHAYDLDLNFTTIINI
jgi:hypothetical protein